MLKKHTHQQMLMSEPFQVHKSWRWPYALALEWMRDAKDFLSRTGMMSVAIGSHDRDIVTLGRHTNEADVLDAGRLERLNVPIYRIDRGGGATIHGPGQIIVYPVVSLSRLQLTVPQFTSRCENALIECVNTFGIRAHTKDKQPGVFVDNNKIGAIGFHVSQGCVTHGLSLNVTNDLSLYDAIAPCGIRESKTTSMASLLSKSDLDIEAVGHALFEIVTQDFARRMQ